MMACIKIFLFWETSHNKDTIEDMSPFYSEGCASQRCVTGVTSGNDVNPGTFTSVTFFVLQNGLVEIYSLRWQGCFLDFRSKLADNIYGEVLPFHKIKYAMR